MFRSVVTTARAVGGAVPALPALGVLPVGADGQPQAAIVSLGERRAVIVDAAMHAAITLPLRASNAADIALAGARFRRGGTEQVAGFGCTDYAVQDAHGSGTLCLTADGVPLRGEGTWNGRAGRFVATHVAYRAQPDELFQVPPGFVQLSLPKNLEMNGGSG